MNALFRIYQLQKEGMDLLTVTVQVAHLALNTRDERIHELEQGMNGQGDLIEQLEGQVQDLHMELDEALDHIPMHHAHDAQHGNGVPDEMDVDEEPEEIEGMFDLDQENEVTVAAPGPSLGANHMEDGSDSSVNNLDDF